MKADLIEAMKAVFGADLKRINHALAVLGYAETLLKTEPGDDLTVTAAAILHDIGIQAAERKHGSSSGHFQEIEGPPIARPILMRLGVDPGKVEHICRIIGSHHSARNIDTPEFRVIWDADWLVNIPDEYPGWGPDRLRLIIDKVFKTGTGRTLAESLFLPGVP